MTREANGALLTLNELKRTLDAWWRDPSWPEEVVREAEAVRARVEAETLSADDGAIELRRFAETLNDANLRAQILVSADRLAADNVMPFGRGVLADLDFRCVFRARVMGSLETALDQFHLRRDF